MKPGLCDKMMPIVAFERGHLAHPPPLDQPAPVKVGKLAGLKLPQHNRRTGFRVSLMSVQVVTLPC
jgi:hypothetical protein